MLKKKPTLNFCSKSLVEVEKVVYFYINWCIRYISANLLKSIAFIFGSKDSNIVRISPTFSYLLFLLALAPLLKGPKTVHHTQTRVWQQAEEQPSCGNMQTRDLHKYGQLNSETERMCEYIHAMEH